MSRKVTIRVARGGVVVDGPLTDRPVRILPGGNSGVVYLGQVYPLHHGNVIDLTDEPVDKGDCRGFVDPYEPIGYSPQRSAPTALLARWYVETNRFGSYLVFDASTEAAEDVVARIESSPLGVRNWGISRRPADNGSHYDFYVRLGQSADPGSVEEALSAIPGLLRPRAEADELTRPEPVSPPVAGEAPVGGVAGLTVTQLVAIASKQAAKTRSELEVVLAKKDQQAAALAAERDAARRQTRDLGARVGELEAQAREADDRLRRLQVDLATARRREAAATEQAKAAQERASAALASTGSDNQQVESLTAQLVEERARTTGLAEEARAAQELAEEAEGAKSELQRKYLDVERQERETALSLKSLQNAHSELQAEFLEVQQERADRHRRGNAAPAQDRLHPLQEFCPRLVFDTETLAIIDDQFRSRGELYDVLLDLDRNTRRYLTKTTGSGDVHEVARHIATGQCSDRGRVYFRRLDERRLFVAVHVKRDKKEQSRFISRFASAAEPELLEASA